ncbi:MAG: hypothetical protein AAF927_01720 [Bacteroidota bacterium]
MEYTREDLIGICEAAIVPQDKWNDRDSAIAHLQLAKAYVLLKAGCKFRVDKEEDAETSLCVTDDDTIWIQFWVKDFMWVEDYDPIHDDPKHKDGYDRNDYHFYLPTRKRLASANGGDWY